MLFRAVSDSNMNMLRRRWQSILVSGTLLVMAVIALSSMVQKSVTTDEYQAMPHGLVILKTGIFSIASGIPPLSEVLSALPVLLFTPAKMDTNEVASYTTSWQCGDQFVEENWQDYHFYFLVSRVVSVLFLVLTCLLVYLYSRRLNGLFGGLLSLVVVCFSPNLIAHGRLVTTEIYLTACIVFTLFVYDRFLLNPVFKNILLTGAGIGLASLMKLSGIFLFLAIPLSQVIGYFWRNRVTDGQYAPQSAVKMLLNIILIVFTGMLIINVGYGFQYSFTPVGEYYFTSSLFQKIQDALPGWLPVPLPYYYVQSFDTQMADTGYTSYVLGKFYEGGVWYYYLVGVLFKTPLATLLLFGLSIFLFPRIRVREVPVVVTAALFFLIFSLVGHKNIGIRYVLFIFPLIGVWIGRLGPLFEGPRSKAGRFMKVIVSGTLLVLVMTCIHTWPDYIPYFNQLAGGPANGHKYLLHSNLDWGQDLVALEKYMAREHIESVDLAYAGRVKPELYGINYTHLTGKPTQRYAVISANLLWGRMYFVNGTRYWPRHRNAYASFRVIKPKAVLGYTLYVYDMSDIKKR